MALRLKFYFDLFAFQSLLALEKNMESSSATQSQPQPPSGMPYPSTCMTASSSSAMPSQSGLSLSAPMTPSSTLLLSHGSGSMGTIQLGSNPPLMGAPLQPMNLRSIFAGQNTEDYKIGDSPPQGSVSSVTLPGGKRRLTSPQRTKPSRSVMP